MFIGVVGAPNKGKSTFFAAATLFDAKIAPFPFTTIEPNHGTAYVRAECPHVSLGRKCNPKNSACIDGVRLIPTELVDVAGLVPDAHEGRGLGLKFLDDLRAADALIQVVDASGKTDAEGKEAVGFDPAEEVRFLEKELVHWIAGIIKRGMAKARGRGIDEIATILSGLKVSPKQTEDAAARNKLPIDKIHWSDEEIFSFAKTIREISKPIAIAANKIDVDGAKQNYERMRELFPDRIVVPACAEAELALRRAAEKGLVKYVPGDKDFEVLGGDDKQKAALEKIRKIIRENGGTGVQELINRTAFDLLQLIPVYPVEDEKNYSNHFGQVLPDAYLLRRGSTACDLAAKIHTDLSHNFICGIDARTHMRIGKEHVLKPNDIVKIVSGR
ncbi:MAG: redox-regulated ATPase YchF [Candidatus Micrarchaeota archaeon]|nr:redox-regulated ATPase YchF [Candidatus Micrarchaeota archaeon]